MDKWCTCVYNWHTCTLTNTYTDNMQEATKEFFPFWKWLILSASYLAWFQESQTMLHHHISTIWTTEVHHLFYHTALHKVDQTGQTQAVAQLKQVKATCRRDSRNIIGVQVHKQLVECVLTNTWEQDLAPIATVRATIVFKENIVESIIIFQT